MPEQFVTFRRLVVVSVIAFVLGALSVVFLARHSIQFRTVIIPLDGGGDDQPPIIVRDGSIHLDGGDILYPHPAWLDWGPFTSSSATTTAYSPNHPTGADVVTFEIIALNVVITDSCPAAPIIADHVLLTYTGVTGDPTPTANIYISQVGKRVPVFETSLKMSAVPMTGTNPGRLDYTTDGTFSGFTTTSATGKQISCTFAPHNNDYGYHGYLRVQPTR